ncbi:MAG: tetratricopeptide repeat protein, partial [Phycisphaerales bacterium]
RMKDHAGAISELEQLSDLSGFQYAAEVGTVLGQCYLVNGDHGAAADAFRKVVRDFPDHDLADDACAGLAEASYLDNRLDDAVGAARSLVERFPDSPSRSRTELIWALALMGKEEYTTAAGRLAELLDRDPEGPTADEAALLLAQCCHRTDALDEAARFYRHVIKRATEAFMPDALMGLGTLFLQQGNSQDAGKLLDRLLKEYPDYPEATLARFHRGRAFFEQDEYDAALRLFDQVARSEGEHQDDAVYWSAKCKLRMGDHAAAARQLAQAIRTYPESDLRPEMTYDHAVAWVQAGDLEKAVEVLGDCLQSVPDHSVAPQALHLLAITQHRRKAYDLSREHCETFLRKHSDHSLARSVRFLEAENEFLAGRYEQAVEGYRRFLSAYPDAEEKRKAQYRLGMALYRLEQFGEASELLKGAAKGRLDEAYQPALLALGDIAFHQNEWKQAEKHLRAYLETGEDVAAADDALLKLGLALQRQGSSDNALRQFDLLMERFPQSPHRLQAAFEEGQILVALGRGPEAVRVFEQVLAEGPESRFAPYALNHLASLEMHGKAFDQAADRFTSVIEQAEDEAVQAQARYQKGQALFAQQRYAEAEQALAEFLEQHPSHTLAGRARAQLAIAIARQDRFEEALRAIERAELQKRTEDGGVDAELARALLYEKAWCLGSLGQDKRAAGIYRQLIGECEADAALCAHALLELAATEIGEKRYEEAAALLQRLRSMMSDPGAIIDEEVREQATYQLAVCSFELQRYDEAAGLCDELIRLFPDSELIPSASYFCGESLFRLEHHERAVAHLERIVDRFPDHEACAPSLLRLGESLAVLQRWTPSELAFSQFMRRFGDHPQWFQAQFGIGYARENQERYDEAIESYRKVIEAHEGPTAARAQFQIGECLFAQKQYKPAIAELMKVDILYAYPEWSAAALYEAGRCFEYLAMEVEARRQFKTVTEKFKDSQWAELAARRLADLSQRTRPGA